MSQTRSEEPDLSGTKGVLDIALILVESWIVLVALPLLAGLAVLVYANILPAVYEATARATSTYSDLSVLQSGQFTQDLWTRTQEVARGIAVPSSPEALRPLLVVVSNQTEGTGTRAVAQSGTPELARAVAEAALSLMREANPLEVDDIATLDADRAEVVRLQASADTLQAVIASPEFLTAPASEQIVVGLIAITRAINERQVDRAMRENELAAQLTLYNAPPQVTVSHISRLGNLPFVVVGAAIILALIIAFLRAALAQARLLPGYDQKIARMRRALFLRSR